MHRKYRSPENGVRLSAKIIRRIPISALQPKSLKHEQQANAAQH
jgi:hypothetical protein